MYREVTVERYATAGILLNIPQTERRLDVLVKIEAKAKSLKLNY